MRKFYEQFNEYFNALTKLDVNKMSAEDLRKATNSFISNTKDIDPQMISFLETNLKVLNKPGATVKNFIDIAKEEYIALNESKPAFLVDPNIAKHKKEMEDLLEQTKDKDFGSLKTYMEGLKGNPDISQKTKDFLTNIDNYLSLATTKQNGAAIEDADRLKTIRSFAESKVNEQPRPSYEANRDNNRAFADHERAITIKNNPEAAAKNADNKNSLIYEMIKGFGADFAVDTKKAIVTGSYELSDKEQKDIEATAKKLGLKLTKHDVDGKNDYYTLNGNITIPVTFAEKGPTEKGGR